MWPHPGRPSIVSVGVEVCNFLHQCGVWSGVERLARRESGCLGLRPTTGATVGSSGTVERDASIDEQARTDSGAACPPLWHRPLHPSQHPRRHHGPTFKVLTALAGPLGVHWSRLAELMYGDPQGDPMHATRLRALDWEATEQDVADRVTWEEGAAPASCETVVRLRNCGTLPWVGFSLVYLGECILREKLEFGEVVPLGRILNAEEWSRLVSTAKQAAVDRASRRRRGSQVAIRATNHRIGVDTWMGLYGLKSVILHPQMDLLLLLWVLREIAYCGNTSCGWSNDTRPLRSPELGFSSPEGAVSTVGYL